MANSQVGIVVSAEDQASAKLKQVQQQIKLTDQQLEASRKAWNNYAISTGQVGSSLDTFIAKEQEVKKSAADLAATHKVSGAAAKESGGIIDRLSQSIQGLAKSATGASGGVGNLFSNLSGGAGRGASAGAAIGVGIAAIGVAALGVGVKVNAEFEKIQTGFTTLLGSASAAAKAMNMIKQDATRTPFDTQGLAQLNLQLTAITGNAGQSERIIMNFGKAMAAMGKNGNDLDGVMTQVFQVLNKGKLEMQDVKPIQNYIDLYGIMSRNLGITREDLIKMQEQGTLTSDMLLEAFEKASNGSGEFAKAYENQGNTLAVSWQNLTGKFKIGLGAFAEQTGVFDAVKWSFQLLNKAFDNSTIQGAFVAIAGVVRIAGAGIIGTIEVIWGAIKSLFSLSWKPFADSLVSAQKRSEEAVSTSWNNLKAVVTKSTDDQVDAYKQGNSAMVQENAAKLLKIKEQEDEANKQFAKQQEQASRQFQQSMTDMIIAHRDKSISIRQNLADEDAAYAKSTAQRKAAYLEDAAALQENYADKVKDINEQISDEQNKGLIVDGVLFQQVNQEKIDKLTQQLSVEETKYQEAMDKRKAKYAQDVTDNQEAHDAKVVQLQASLDEELAILDKHRADVAAVGNAQKDDDITRLKSQFAQQTTLANQDHAESIARIRKQATEQGLTGGSSYTDAMTSALTDASGTLGVTANQLGTNTGKELGKGIVEGIGEGLKPDSDSVLGKLITNVQSLKDDPKNTLKALFTGIDQATGAFTGLSAIYSILPGGERASSMFKSLAGRASGGPVQSGSPYIVGEKGKELFVPRQSGTIIPANQTRQMLNGQSGQSVTIGAVHLYNQTDTSAFLREIAFELS